MSFNFIKTEIEGVYIIEPRIFEDARGYCKKKTPR